MPIKLMYGYYGRKMMIDNIVIIRRYVNSQYGWWQ
jgi:hypothetical protein